MFLSFCPRPLGHDVAGRLWSGLTFSAIIWHVCLFLDTNANMSNRRNRPLTMIDDPTPIERRILLCNVVREHRELVQDPTPIQRRRKQLTNIEIEIPDKRRSRSPEAELESQEKINRESLESEARLSNELNIDYAFDSQFTQETPESLGLCLKQVVELMGSRRPLKYKSRVATADNRVRLVDLR